jgi:hypothetical protein
MKKKQRKFTKAQKAWRKQYTDKCFGIEPCMYEDDYLEGDISFAEYQRRNVQWVQDHFQEIVDGLWDPVEV